MREMIYRNLSSPDRCQKDMTLAEIREDQGVTTELHKRYTYRVRAVEATQLPAEVLPLPGVPDVWELRANPMKHRQIFVRKLRQPMDGAERFTYKIVGSFYATREGHVYLVTYRHILHMAVSNPLAGDE